MNDMEYIFKITEYMAILKERHIMFDDPDDKGLNVLLEDLCRVVSTLPIMMDYGETMLSQRSGVSEKEKQFVIDQLKYFANLCLFIDAVLPLCSKYNPSNEDKKKFLEFIGYTPEE